MKALIVSLMVIGVLALVGLVLGINLAIAFLAFKLVLWAGAPKYVAVITGIVVFCIGSSVVKIKSAE